jgi:asparagine synthase (glutamine-hydrolysing)
MGSLVAHLSRRTEPDSTLAQKMLKAAPHRGDQIRTTNLGRCALAVSYRADAPDATIAVRDGLAAAVVGRIDNPADLSREAKVDAVDFDQATLVIEAFRAMGTQLPERMRGAYAVLMTDGQSVWCFRDHLGFSPLFYRVDSAGLSVATEAKQVVAGSDRVAEPDVEVIERIFYEEFDDEGACALAGVSRLPKSTILNGAPDKVVLSRYWQPERLLETARFSPDELALRFNVLMARAVDRVLTGDDMVTLSGGIDSPAIAAFAAPSHLRATGRPLDALSAVYPDHPAVDESRYVEVIARRLGLLLHTYRPHARPLDDLEHWVRLADGPFPTTSMAEARELYEIARGFGLRNILTGEIAEFLIDFRASVVPHLLKRGRVAAAMRNLSSQRARGASFVALARQALAPFTPQPLLSLYAKGRRRPSRRFPDWITPPSWLPPRTVAPPGDRWLQAQLSAFKGPGLSLEADETLQALMGVRVRRPWADVDLWEFFLSLPAETKFPDGRSKTLVRRLLVGKVPDEILQRRSKTVFDDSVRARIDYAVLRRWLLAPDHRLKDVDYQKLGGHLEREDLDLSGFIWARDLAAVQAFLAQW